MIMEESVALSPHGLRPAYLHDKNYLIKNYLILIKQLIILLLSKKNTYKNTSLSEATAPKRPLNRGKAKSAPMGRLLLFPSFFF